MYCMSSMAYSLCSKHCFIEQMLRELFQIVKLGESPCAALSCASATINANCNNNDRCLLDVIV